jgi:nucleoid DNA-binding protein
MTIKYKIGRARLRDEELLYPRLVPEETTSAQEFQDKVAQRAARGLADVVAVFIAAREVLLEELLEKQAVQMPGLGTFTLSIQGELDDKKRLISQSARLNINYRPQRSLRRDVNRNPGFEYVG